MSYENLQPMMLGVPRDYAPQDSYKRVIVAGSRNFNDYEMLEFVLTRMRKGVGDFEIVSGGAAGADKLGERYAKENGLKVRVFPYESNYGKQGGPIRNEKMAMYGDTLVAFWDGKSKGTDNMIKNAFRYNLRTLIYEYDK